MEQRGFKFEPGKLGPTDRAELESGFEEKKIATRSAGKIGNIIPDLRLCPRLQRPRPPFNDSAFGFQLPLLRLHPRPEPISRGGNMGKIGGRPLWF